MSRFLGPIFIQIHSNFPKKCLNHLLKYSTSNKKSKEKTPFIILDAKPPDHSKIVSLLYKSYHPHEPLSKGLGLGNCSNPVIDDAMYKDLSNNLSVIAMHKGTGKIAGCSINTVAYDFTAAEILQHSKCICCEKTRHLFEFYAYINSIPQLYRKYNTKKIYEIAYVAVDIPFRRQGLAYQIMKDSLKRGHRRGFKVVRVDCTNVATAKICEKLGMQKVFEIPFDYYLDKNKKPIIKMEYPNVSCQTYVHLCK